MRGDKGFSAADLISVFVDLQIEVVRMTGVAESGRSRYEPLVRN